MSKKDPFVTMRRRVRALDKWFVVLCACAGVGILVHYDVVSVKNIFSNWTSSSIPEVQDTMT